MKSNEGHLENEVCNREGCKGVITDSLESCSCHLNPPCSKCVGDGLYCPVCGWHPSDDYTPSAPSAPSVPSAPVLPKKQVEDDGNLYSVVRYFDSILEGYEARGKKFGEASRILSKLNRKERYYVSYSMVKEG